MGLQRRRLQVPAHRWLSEIQESLPSASFGQVSRPAVVNAQRVLRVRPVGSSYEAEMEGGGRIGVSRRRVKALEATVGLG
ncbi:MAG: LytTR family DNA-binding domain-containing protein [Myxococcota bacterium]